MSDMLKIRETIFANYLHSEKGSECDRDDLEIVIMKKIDNRYYSSLISKDAPGKHLIAIHPRNGATAHEALDGLLKQSNKLIDQERRENGLREQIFANCAIANAGEPLDFEIRIYTMRGGTYGAAGIKNGGRPVFSIVNSAPDSFATKEEALLKLLDQSAHLLNQSFVAASLK